MDIELNHLVALVAGICILVFPKVLNYIVAGYLIAIALFGIFDLRIN